ncbi:MAG: protein translocase subunit SecF [Oscillospiraceae bacterium]|nr:protein translocase subunit SecF [Oscillospiraceae bacterium]
MKENKKTFDFVKNFKFTGLISIVLALTGLVGLLLAPFGVFLFNFDIDFVGGTTMQFEMHQDVTAELTAKVSGIVAGATGVRPSSVIKAGDAGTQVVIKCAELSSEMRDAAFEAVRAAYNLPETDSPIKSEFVSASVGSDLKRSAVLASAIAVALILVYITIRFQFFSGLAAVIALVHDLLIMLSVYIIFRIPFNMNFIAAALTILGYSINATIVVFDRVRENIRLEPEKKFGQIVDTSIHQTLSRSVNTTLTTLFAIVLLVVFGVDSIRNFALPVCVGVICGCYSSVCISGPMWNLFESKKKAA